MAKQAGSQVVPGITCLHSPALADIVMQSGKAKAILASVGTARARFFLFVFHLAWRKEGDLTVTWTCPH